MADYSTLKTAIQAVIRTNGNEEITGALLQQSLLAMIDSLGAGFQFMGVATTSTTPGTPDQNVFYLAFDVGTYINFGGTSLGNGQIGVFSYNGNWTYIVKTIGQGGGGGGVSDVTLGGTSVVDGNGVAVLPAYPVVPTLATVATTGDYDDLLDKPTIPTNVVQYSAQSLTDAQKGQARTNIGALSSADVASLTSEEYVEVASLPTADATTLGKIYLVGPDGNGDYDRYITSYDGVNYTWQQIGSTAIDLSDYATKEEVDQLEQDVDGVDEKLNLELHGRTRVAKRYVWSNGYVNSSGKIALSAASLFCQPILMKAGEKLTYKSGSDYAKAVVSVADDTPLSVGSQNFIVATLIAANTSGREYTYTFSEDTYVVISVYATSYTLTVEQFKGDSIDAQIADLAMDAEQAVYGTRKNYTDNKRIQEGKIRVYANYSTTDFIPCVKDNVVVWKFGGVGSTDIRLELFDTNKTYLDYYSSSSYTGERTITISNASCAFIRATFRTLNDDGTINENPITVGENKFYVLPNKNGYTDFIKIGELNDALRWKPMPLGGLLNCDTDSNGHLSHSATYDSKRVTTKSTVTVPFPGCRVRARIPNGLNYVLTFYLWLGESNGSLSTTDTIIFYDKSEMVLPKTAVCIRPVFRAYLTNSTDYSVEINADEIESMIQSGELAIEYYDDAPGCVVERNDATRINLSALRRVLIPSPLVANGMDTMPVFAHITDLHGDAPRWKNFLDYCDSVGVDFALETGDAVMAQKRDSSEYIFDFADEHNTEVLACIGNHESLPTGSSTLFADNISNLATKYGYLAASGTATTKCYYYKDYDEKKLRVIVLNQYEDGVNNLRFGQDQIDWFVATLLSTPTGYGVVIAYHAPEDKIVAESPNDGFMQPNMQPSPGYYVDKRAISLIIDAFIERGTASFTYNDHSATYNGNDDTTTQTISVVADFSGVDASTEFICYVCGHRHKDDIGYYNNAVNKQLSLCITTGNALYGDSTNPEWANESDLPRGGRGVSQDAFCIYAIDRMNGNVKVMRVGATVTQMMVKREMMVIPYKD